MLKALLARILLILTVMIGLGAGIGCSSTHRATKSDLALTQPPVIMEVLDQSLDQYAPLWQAEIGRKFTNAVGILVHGGDFVEGQWIVGSSLQPQSHVTPVADIVRHFQQKYPNRVIVLLACNTGHLKLGIPGVFYAHSSVWCVPDRGLTPQMLATGEDRMTLGLVLQYAPETPQQHPTRWQEAPEVVGSIYEFTAD